MTREKLNKLIMQACKRTWNEKTCKEIEQALSQEPCDDAISRILKRMWNCRGKHTTSIDKVAMEQIIRDELPSVTQKSGKWIAVYQGDEIINYRCSECELGDTNGSTNLYGWDYCRRCGAKMESEDKE